MHHNDLPGGDPRHDITDLFVFQAAEDPTRVVVILNVHPELLPGIDPVDSRVSYEVKMDLNGDLEADLAFHILFDRHEDGSWSASVWRAVGSAARGVGSLGKTIFQRVPVSAGASTLVSAAQDHRFFAGPRSDPFFADRDGFANEMRWTGRDYFVDKDVFSIALELPQASFSGQNPIAVWARTVGIATGHVLNQAGRPGNNVLRPEPEIFQTSTPADQLERYLPRYVENFLAMGYSESEASRLAMEWLPDVLTFDVTNPLGFPNGRRLSDDVVATAVQVLTRKPLPPSAWISVHADLLADFPYLGPPHHM